MALELPTELLVVGGTHADAPTFVAMQATCKTWLDAVRAAGAQVTDRLWHAFALARFPRAAAIVKHATGPVAGYTLYRAQLQADRAEYLPVAQYLPAPAVQDAVRRLSVCAGVCVAGRSRRGAPCGPLERRHRCPGVDRVPIVG